MIILKFCIILQNYLIVNFDDRYLEFEVENYPTIFNKMKLK